LIVRLVGVASPVQIHSIVVGNVSAFVLHEVFGQPFPSHVNDDVASAVPLPGPTSARQTMLATASQPALRNVVARFRRVECVFIRRYPRELRRECRE